MPPVRTEFAEPNLSDILVRHCKCRSISEEPAILRGLFLFCYAQSTSFTQEGMGMAKKAKQKKQERSGKDALFTALGHPLRVRILAALYERTASPNEISKEFKEGLSQISYHFKVLKDCKCIRMVKTEPRRGAVEHFYITTVEEPWAKEAIGLT